MDKNDIKVEIRLLLVLVLYTRPFELKWEFEREFKVIR